MPYMSELLGKPVADVDGTRIGHLDDVIAIQRGDVPHPVVVAIVVKRGRGNLIVPMSDVVVLIAPAISLTKQTKDLETYTPGPTDLYLARDVLDKQIIDTDGVRVVRVNDLELTRVNVDFYVANVDISGLGLMRRLGMGKVAQRFTGRSQRKDGPTGTISWDDIELLSPDQPMRLRVSSDRISDLHPADLAEIISDLTRTESDKLLESLDVETVAETLEEVEPEFQAALVETMPDERVADVLEEMSPDAAADLLAELPEGRSEDLLNLMEKDDAADVRKLLSYPDDSAGGLMTTEYVAVQPDLTAEQTIAVLRELGPDAETIYYVYAVDETGKLVGVFSLRDLVIAKPNVPIAPPRRNGQYAG
jgi:magnesium transporter